MNREDIGLLVASAIVLYVLLWWAPPLISWILRQIIRILGTIEWVCHLVFWTIHKTEAAIRRGIEIGREQTYQAIRSAVSGDPVTLCIVTARLVWPFTAVQMRISS
jgi:hypothetical protein